MAKILIVEDEHDMAEGLRDNLVCEGYEVVCAPDGEKGLELAERENPDLVLLDIMLPGIDGYEVCKQMRAAGIDVPVIMLTAKSQEVDKVFGLELGADDYITKPFSIREVQARIKAVLRRKDSRPSKMESYEFGGMTVDFRRGIASKNNTDIELSHYENEILRMLVANKDEPVSRNRLLDEVWGYDLFPTTRTIDNHVVKLRQKIEADPHDPRHVITVHGIGYKFVE